MNYCDTMKNKWVQEDMAADRTMSNYTDALNGRIWLLGSGKGRERW